MIPISVAEKQYLRGGIEQDLREDGRHNLDYRKFTIETNVIPQCNGSARVTLEHTEVIVGVKVEIGDPDTSTPTQGRAEMFIELSPSVLSTGNRDKVECELVRCLKPLISSPTALDWKKLCINAGSHCWVVYIDCLIVDSSGNILDTTAMAIKAALSTTKIPKIEKIVKKSDDENIDEKSSDQNPEEIEITLSSNPDDFEWLETDQFPLGITIGVVGTDKYIVDPTMKEERCLDTALFVTTNGKNNTLTGTTLIGGLPLSVEQLKTMIQHGKTIASNIITQLDDIKKKEQQGTLY